MNTPDTIIKVALTRTDEYGNLWVTPAGGGVEVKIGEKRNSLFPLFQQGNTVSLHWETYKDKPYVKDAKQIVGEPAQPAKLPVPQPAQREPFLSDPTRNASIEAQTAYGKIMDNWEKDIPKSMKDAAVHWGLSKLGVKELPTTLKAPEKPADKEVHQPAQQEASLPVLERPVGMLASITDGTKLFSYVNKRGVSLAEWTSTVQSSPNEVKTEAQLIAAWNVLAPKLVK